MNNDSSDNSNTQTESRKGMRLAYLCNEYPKVSHSFVRREVVELERRGHQVVRLSIRDGGKQVDPGDQAEAQKTIFVLSQSVFKLLCTAFVLFLKRPGQFCQAFKKTWEMNRVSDRGLIPHLAYLIEAAFVTDLLERHGVQHMHVHFGTNPTSVARLVKALGGPSYSMTIHGPDELDAPIGHSLGGKIEDAAFVVAITNYCAAQLRRWVGYKHWDKFVIVHCALPEESFITDQPVEDTNTFVTVGRLTAQKGQLLLVNAVAKLVNEGLDLHFILAGDGEMRQVVEERIRQTGTQDNFTITGWISGQQVRDHLKESRAMVLPSFAEGLPVVIMEAFAMHRPVISTYIAGIPELVIDGQNGWLVFSGSVDDLANAIRECLNTPIDQLRQLGAHGYECVSKAHRIKTEVDKLEDAIYHAVANKDENN